MNPSEGDCCLSGDFAQAWGTGDRKKGRTGYVVWEEHSLSGRCVLTTDAPTELRNS